MNLHLVQVEKLDGRHAFEKSNGWHASGDARQPSGSPDARQRPRRVGIVKGSLIVLLDASIQSTYFLFTRVINSSNPGDELAKVLASMQTTEELEYDQVYSGNSPWHLLPPIDCPGNPMQCFLSGTGLTHKASAENREKMHNSQKENRVTDSMIMYQWGEEGGKPEAGKIGVQPEWFYKGNGSGLRGHRQSLLVPEYADDGGEEPEIAGIYLVSERGVPHRIGFAQANEFSDHVMEKKNYLYLAPSKIRTCAIGPELVVNGNFENFPGRVSVSRSGKELWSKAINTGESAITHSLENLEYHHFKYEQHRIAGMLHVHFFGADAFSFGAGIKLEQGDEMSVSFEGMGRPLVNSIDFVKESKFDGVKSVVS